jgi:transposase InsO family protein
VKALCERYGVTRAGYYAWRRRETSRHDRQDERLVARIRAIRRYNRTRIHSSLDYRSPIDSERIAA